MKKPYDAPSLEFLYIYLEECILSQIDPGHEYGDDDY